MPYSRILASSEGSQAASTEETRSDVFQEE